MASFANTSFIVLLFICQNIHVTDGQSVRCLSTSIILLFLSLPLPSPVAKMYHAGNTKTTSSATGWLRTQVHYFLSTFEISKFSTIFRSTKDFGYSYPETAALKYFTSHAEKGDLLKKTGKTYDSMPKIVPVQGTDSLWVPGMQLGERSQARQHHRTSDPISLRTVSLQTSQCDKNLGWMQSHARISPASPTSGFRSRARNPVAFCAGSLGQWGGFCVSCMDRAATLHTCTPDPMTAMVAIG